MKTLYLVRHAKSSWDYPELMDIDRPLNGRGRRACIKMGHRLKEKGIMPDVMLSSPAKRAFTTCVNIAREIGYDEQLIRTDSHLYHAGEHALLNVIRAVADTHHSAMLFGHNPGFTYFANALAKTSIDNIPTCGIFACQFSTEAWREIRLGNGELLFYDYPKKQTL